MQKQKVDQSGRPQVIQGVANKPRVECGTEAQSGGDATNGGAKRNGNGYLTKCSSSTEHIMHGQQIVQEASAEDRGGSRCPKWRCQVLGLLDAKPSEAEGEKLKTAKAH